MTGTLSLTARLSTAAGDARRGVVRLHPEAMAALGLGGWDAVRLTGTRSTVALAAPAGRATAPGQAELDETAMTNAGIVDGSPVGVTPVTVVPARSVTLAGSRLARTAVDGDTLRLALTGKVLVAGDTLSLLPQDLAPVPGADAAGARRRLTAALGGTWTSELVSVTAVEPADAAALGVGPATVVTWQDAPAPPGGPAPAVAGSPPGAGSPAASAIPTDATAGSEPAPAVPVADLIGHQNAAARLREWLELVFRRPELLTRLGAAAVLGVQVAGPEGVGKATLVRAVAAAVGARVVALDAPGAAALEPASAAERVRSAVADATAGHGPTVLLVTDVDALLPAAEPAPLATVVLEALRAAVGAAHTALVVTTRAPEGLDPRLRDPELVDRELGLAAPDDRERAELLRVLLRAIPLAADVDLSTIGARTPGFVAADLVALRREAAVRAAVRGAAAPGGDGGGGREGDGTGEQDGAREQAGTGELTVTQADLVGAVGSVRPTALSSGSATLSAGGLTLDDVGDMVETKQALTETVLWPLRYPDSFARLGVQAPRGVLLFGPPGCGKTFLVRALAGAGALNVFVVKGAELLDKYVGESERAVRELFTRAADAAPALVFLDEVDALAPRRGGSTDAGVTDRVVAALLTELDGADPRRDVVVLGATNRPELIDPALLRPGRLERRVSVPPPDAAARAAILRAAGAEVPFAADVRLDDLAAELEGYSAADCAALVREAALSALRRSLDSHEVTADDVAAARSVVRPSLDAAQLAELAAYADRA